MSAPEVTDPAAAKGFNIWGRRKKEVLNADALQNAIFIPP